MGCMYSLETFHQQRSGVSQVEMSLSKRPYKYPSDRWIAISLI